MGEKILKYPLIYALVNLALLTLLSFSFILIFGKPYVDNRMDERIIEEYQKPIVGKLDTLINLYSNGRGIEVRDTTTVYRQAQRN